MQLKPPAKAEITCRWYLREKSAFEMHLSETSQNSVTKSWLDAGASLVFLHLNIKLYPTAKYEVSTNPKLGELTGSKLEGRKRSVSWRIQDGNRLVEPLINSFHSWKKTTKCWLGEYDFYFPHFKLVTDSTNSFIFICHHLLYRNFSEFQWWFFIIPITNRYFFLSP